MLFALPPASVPLPPLLLAGLQLPATPVEWLLWAIASYTAIEKLWGVLFGGTGKRLDKLETAVSSFVPEPDIKAKNEEMGRQIADCQGKVKAYHDAAESNYNALNMRTAALEQHTTSLTLLPSQVQKLNTDHAVLASEVRTLAGNIKDLSEKQDSHFRDLMNAVGQLAYTRGELHAGQRPPISLPPNS